MSRSHRVHVTVSREAGSITTDEVLSYSIRNDMMSVADDFALELPVSRQLWDLMKPDSVVECWIDDSQVLYGFIDSRKRTANGISISGRDKGGRLTDEAAPLQKFGGGITLKEVFENVVADWFDEVTLVNTDNRKLIGGRHRKRNTTRTEPIYTRGSRELRKKVNPGERIADVLTELSEQAGVLFWSTADGRQLFVGLPNQVQDHKWEFIQAPPGASRGQESSVRDMVITEDLSDYFSEIVVCGAGKGDRSNYGRNVLKRRSAVTDGDGPSGTGNLFFRPKRHLITDPDVKSPADAFERAVREQAELGSHVQTVEVTVGGHGQLTGTGKLPEIFHFDSHALVRDDEIGLRDDYFVTAVTFEGDRDDDSSVVTCVPVGTELKVNG